MIEIHKGELQVLDGLVKSNKPSEKVIGLVHWIQELQTLSLPGRESEVFQESRSVITGEGMRDEYTGEEEDPVKERADRRSDVRTIDRGGKEEVWKVQVGLCSDSTLCALPQRQLYAWPISKKKNHLENNDRFVVHSPFPTGTLLDSVSAVPMVSLGIHLALSDINNYVPRVSPQPHLALTIPEILERILSFLSNRQRRFISSLVCRLWLVISRHLGTKPPHRLVWSPNLENQEHDRVLKALSSTYALSLSTDVNRSDQGSLFWHELLYHMQSRLAKEQLVHLHDVEVRGSSMYCSHIVPALSLLPALTTLRLLRTGLRTWRLFRELLELCPNLEELYLQPGQDTPFPRSHDQGGQTPLGGLPELKRMQVLVLHDLVIRPGTLEAMVELCPRLKELRVVRVRVMSSANNANIPKPETFFRHLAKSCPQLRRLHFSIAHRRYTESDLRTLFEPKYLGLKEVSFMDVEMNTPSGGTLLSPLAAWLQTWLLDEAEQAIQRSGSILQLPSPLRCSNQVTWLELTGVRQPYLSKESGPVLHQFLCHSPNLQHLIAPNLAIYIDFLDINGMMKESLDTVNLKTNLSTKQHGMRSTPNMFGSTFPHNRISPSTNGTTASNHRIWACRRLRTLHIGFEAREMISDKGRGNLILFGYLERICPELEDLYIRRHLMDLTRYGGLCLLTRLRKLERLVLDCDVVQEFELSDLNWIKRHPNMTLFAFWKHLRHGKDHKPKRMRQISDVIDMTNVGRVMDLVNWKREREQEAKRMVPCWPCLETFQIRCKEKALWQDHKIPDFRSLRRDALVEFQNIRIQG